MVPRLPKQSSPEASTEVIPAPDPAKVQALDLFMAHASMADISRATGVGLKVLRRWSNDEDWPSQREDGDRSIIESAFGSRKVAVAKIAKIASDQLLRGLEHIAKRPDPATLDEQVKIASILGQLDKLARLDAGKSTENIALAGTIAFTAAQVREAITTDPFFSEIPASKQGSDE